MTLSNERIGGCLIATFSVAYALLALQLPVINPDAVAMDARSLPLALATCGFLSGLGLCFAPAQTKVVASPLGWPVLVAFLILMSLYGFSIRPGGFLLPTFGFLSIGFYLLGERNFWIAGGVAAMVSIGFWWLMTQLLGVYLPALPPILTAAT